MTDHPQSEAARLAAVLRVLAPGVHFLAGTSHMLGETEPKPVVLVRGLEWPRDWPNRLYPNRLYPDSKDDLARVVAMLSEEQRQEFDQALTIAIGHTTGAWPDRVKIQPSPSMTLTADPSVLLDALCAATGVNE